VSTSSRGRGPRRAGWGTRQSSASVRAGSPAPER